MTTEDIERIVKLHQSITDKEIQKLLLQILAIEVQIRGITAAPKLEMIGRNT